MQLINYDNLDPKYDRMLYLDNGVYTYSKPKHAIPLTVDVSTRILIIDGLEDPNIEKVYKKPKKDRKIFFRYKDGYERYVYVDKRVFKENKSELLEIEKKVTKNIILTE